MQILDLADIKNGNDVLEIGCGWGAFAEAALDAVDCHVTGITLSEEQLAYSRRRLDGRTRARKSENSPRTISSRKLGLTVLTRSAAKMAEVKKSIGFVRQLASVACGKRSKNNHGISRRTSIPLFR